MKKIVQLLFACLLFTHPLFPQEDSCAGSTWIKLLGQPGTQLRGSVLCPAGDGNLYVTGSKLDSGLILKINPDGDILWARSFDFFPGYDDILFLNMDSDGMLLGAVGSGPTFNGFNYSCYFKYDPQQDKFLWAWRPEFYNAYEQLMGIIEKYPGGNYLINFYSALPPNEEVIMEIDRQTGQEIPGTSWRYDWQNSGGHEFQFSYLNDSLILISEDGFSNSGFERLRLVCISASNGQPKWWQRSHLPHTDSANLDMRDFIVDDDAIVNASSGNDQIYSLSQRFIFLQKTTFDGDILWVKKYDLLEFPAESVTEIVRASDGYVMFGRSQSSVLSDLFILKTDFDGNVMWTRRYDYSISDAIVLKTKQNEFLEMDGFFYFTAYFRDTSNATDWVIAKVDSEGLVGDSCAYLTPTPVVTYPILHPVQEKPPLSFRNLDFDFCSPVPAKGTSATDVSGYRTICEHICENEEGCDVKINGCVKFELLSIALDADGDRHYRVRFTNSCAGQNLNYLAIQLSNGTVAVEPQEGDVYTTENGHNYLVRNPNYSPFYSIRFKSQGTGIGNGASDVFEYELIGQSQPSYINVFARLWPGPSYEAHLNVFNCPVQQVVQNRGDDISGQVSIAPNPVSELLTVTLPEARAGRWRIFSADGREMGAGRWSEAGFTVPTVGLPSGVYYLRLCWDGISKVTNKRFVKIR